MQCAYDTVFVLHSVITYLCLKVPLDLVSESLILMIITLS